MDKHMKTQTRIIAMSLLLVGVAQAQLTLTGRYSELRYDYVYGFGGPTQRSPNSAVGSGIAVGFRVLTF